MPEPAFAINQFTTKPLTWDQDLALYEKLGVRHVELCQSKLDPDPARAQDQLRDFKVRGFVATSFQPTVHSLFPDRLAPQPEDVGERAKKFHEAIELFGAEFRGAGLPLVAIGGCAPGHYNLRFAHKMAREYLPDLADHAADFGLRLAWETLHPVEMHEDSFTCQLDESILLVENVNRANFGHVVDTFHLWQERDIGPRLEALGEKIFLVHVGDWPAGSIRHLDDRLCPGDGKIKLPHLFESIQRAGYQGPYVLELLSDENLSESLWKTDPAYVINRSREALQRLLGAGIRSQESGVSQE